MHPPTSTYPNTVIRCFGQILQDQITRISLTKNIIVSMDRKEYTPTKQSKLFSGAAYTPNAGRESLRTGELTIVREYQVLRGQARQLQMQNRQLSSEVERLRFEKGQQQAKLVQKATFEQQAVAQLQKEKNYQIEMLRLKNQEQLNRMRRDYEAKVEDVFREIRNREAVGKELLEKSAYMEGKVSELRSALDLLDTELHRFRESNSALSDRLSHEQFANKKLQKLGEELQRHKVEMETEIHILLDIQAEKSRTISNLELQLHNSQNSERALQHKLATLTENFLTLEEHIAVMKDRLGNADFRGQDLDQQLQRVEYAIAEKEQTILEQRDRQTRLRQEIQAHKEREARRLQQIQHLMGENQRAYRDLAGIRHRLYDVSIEQGVDL